MPRSDMGQSEASALATVLNAATQHAERLRWLGYPEQVREAADIDEAVVELRREEQR